MTSSADGVTESCIATGLTTETSGTDGQEISVVMTSSAEATSASVQMEFVKAGSTSRGGVFQLTTVAQVNTAKAMVVHLLRRLERAASTVTNVDSEQFATAALFFGTRLMATVPMSLLSH